MDQTAPANQIIFRYLRERRQESDLGRNLGVCPRGHRQEAPQSQGRSLHNSTDTESDFVRKNIIKTNAYEWR